MLTRKEELKVLIYELRQKVKRISEYVIHHPLMDFVRKIYLIMQKHTK